MSDIVIYTSSYCSYCHRARALLDSKGVCYTVLDVDANPRLWDEVIKRTGCDTVPQIFIGNRHVGGCDDLFDLERKGVLEPLLGSLIPET